jgi:anti-sigma B factor antagonist
MEVITHNDGVLHFVEVKGELDASSAIKLDYVLQQALDQGHKKILVDFAALHYISSPGIGVFTSKLEDCQKNNVLLVLFGMNENVLNVFKILGLDQLLTIVTTKEQAKTKAHDSL